MTRLETTTELDSRRSHLESWTRRRRLEQNKLHAAAEDNSGGEGVDPVVVMNRRLSGLYTYTIELHMDLKILEHIILCNIDISFFYIASIFMEKTINLKGRNEREVSSSLYELHETFQKTMSYVLSFH